MSLQSPILIMFLRGATVVMLIWGLLIGTVMLISPAYWNRLPPWLTWRGSMPQSVVKSSAGRLEIRLAGFVLFATTSTVLAAFGGYSIDRFMEVNPLVVVAQYLPPKLLCVVASVLGVAAGIRTWFRPGWWHKRNPAHGPFAQGDAVTPRPMTVGRALAIPFAGIWLYLGLRCFFDF